MKTLKAIETNYAGCRFRSRLEARWAVFFDSISTPWFYEPQGYTVGPDATPYLPDFWLPEFDLWVEVKGALKPEEFRLLLYAASQVGLPVGPLDGRCDPQDVYPWRGRILLLGDVPQSDTTPYLHTRIDAIGDHLLGLQTVLIRPTARGWTTVEFGALEPANQYLVGANPLDFQAYLRPISVGFVDAAPRVNEALKAARSARFEHGESGAA